MTFQSDESSFPPGTVRLTGPDPSTQEAEEHAIDDANTGLVLQPQPSSDPNDPLNWSKWRKLLNLSIALLYTFIVYAILDIAPPLWTSINEDLGITFDDLNNGFAAGLAGLATAAILLIPLCVKFGRRPLYVGTSAALLGSAIWMARQNTRIDYIVSNLLCGIAGSLGDILVQLTIADLFFIHQRGTMNALYGIMANLGVFGAPIIGGIIAERQTWRWVFWYCTIICGLTLALTLICLEETKYQAIVITSVEQNTHETKNEIIKTSTRPETALPRVSSAITQGIERQDQYWIDNTIPKRSHLQRMALVTVTPGTLNEFLNQVARPFIYLYSFPAVTFAAISFGSCLSWFSVLVTTQPILFSESPYFFGPIEIGLLAVPALIGAIMGSLWGGWFSDMMIVWAAARNKGIHEPEVRLWVAVLPTFVGPAGILIYGLCTLDGDAWIIPCIGIALFAFSMASFSNISFMYLYDSYVNILGGALVAVTFIRNAMSTVIVFAFNPWVAGMGYRNTFILASCIAWALNLLVLPLMFYGKRIRKVTATRYKHYGQFETEAM